VECWLLLSSKYYASRLLSNNVEIKIEITIILPLIFYRYETAAQTQYLCPCIFSPPVASIIRHLVLEVVVVVVLSVGIGSGGG
jgi:hypothetical protein